MTRHEMSTEWRHRRVGVSRVSCRRASSSIPRRGRLGGLFCCQLSLSGETLQMGHEA